MATRTGLAARLFVAWAFLGLTSAALSQVAPPDDADQVVSLLDAQRDGSVHVVARGHGQSSVKFTITNKTARRLKVVIPPGLVAAAPVTQGFQSMGLGGLSDQPGRFGRAGALAGTGFRSVPTAPAVETLAISADQKIDVVVPSVCLNFGVPTPTTKDTFELKDVSEYTSDPRAVKALRSLVALGTSQGVAQAVAWHVFNDMSFDRIAKEGRQYVNHAEVSVAARFAQALDASGSHEIVDAGYFRDGRVLVRTSGASSMGKVADRLAGELTGVQMFGLPVQMVDEISAEHAQPATLLLDAVIVGQGDRVNQTRVRANLSYHSATHGWTRLAPVDVIVPASPTNVTGDQLARALDREIAASAVTTTVARRGTGTTTLKVVNRLPMTVNNVVLRTGRSDGAPEYTVEAVGIGPGRSALVTIPAAIGSVERVESNGL